MLTIHHLGISQSERIIWLCEELGVSYNIQYHTRDPLVSPESLKSLPGNKTGKSPFIQDGDLTLSESGAVCEYIIAKYGNGALAPKYGDTNYVDFIYWFHYANAGLQPLMSTNMFIGMSGAPADDPAKSWSAQRLQSAFQQIDERLKSNKWLAGDEFTAADIMTVFSLTTQRYFGPLVSLEPYPSILRYLNEVGERPGYKRAMEKGDPEMQPLLGAEPPQKSLLELGGTNNDAWKKKSVQG